MTRRAVRVGLVGLGRIGQLHARNLVTGCSSLELVGIVDTNATLAADMSTQLGVPALGTEDLLLDDPSIDAVIIATPVASHASLSVKAARAGKHVFCEKPIALDHDTTVWTLGEVERTGVVFQVGFHRRFDPDWVAAARRVHAGELGIPHLFRASLRDMQSPPVEFLASSGGLFVDLTIHDFDAARWMMGEVAEMSAYGGVLSDPALAEVGDIDTAVVTVRFESGALGFIDNSRSAGYGYECSTEVVGSQATLRIENASPHGVEWLSPGSASRGLPRDFEERFPLAYGLELEAFAGCIVSGMQIRVTGWDALAAFDLATAAALSYQRGERVVVRAHRQDSGIVYELPDPA
ncbi:MAG: Gfo/Idh/MocA family oxidoreductase [Acidimicrobiales bacterium]